jgi:hypothetical protein
MGYPSSSMELVTSLWMQCNGSGHILSANAEFDANLWRDIEVYDFSERNISTRIISFLSVLSLSHVLLYCNSRKPLTIYTTCFNPPPLINCSLSLSPLLKFLHYLQLRLLCSRNSNFRPGHLIISAHWTMSYGGSVRSRTVNSGSTGALGQNESIRCITQNIILKLKEKWCKLRWALNVKSHHLPHKISHLKLPSLST